MRKIFASSIVLVLFIILCTTVSCNKTSPPTDCISAIADSFYVGQTVTFTSCSQGATSYLWNFGDGTTATTATATHAYTMAGMYGVSFTAFNSGGAGIVRTLTVTVFDASWTFKGITYYTDTCVTPSDSSYGILFADNQTPSNNYSFSGVDLKFYHTLPATSGVFTVINGNGNPTSADQVGLWVLTGGGVGTPYISTGGNSNNQKVYVTVANGKINVSTPGVEVANYFNPSDSSVLSFNITKTQ
jgi:PKD repeat protein